MLRKLLLLVLFTGLFVPAVYAQTGTVSGTITNAKNGKVIPGANVQFPTIGRGAATDANGNFSIPNIPIGTYTIHITFVGYNAYVKTINVTPGNNQVNVALKQGAVGLDQLVVTGYAPAESKKDLTSSVSSVSSDDFEDVPLQNTEGILQGRAAGVQVTSNSGTPGGGFSVNIRGTNSINAGTRPLYVVDGVKLSFSNIGGAADSSPLNSINPDNIESVQVLKDAAATAIYGSEGSNGVVVINTKHGVAGKTRVSASYSRGTADFIRNNRFFNRDQYIEFNLAALQYDNPGASSQAVENFFRQNVLPSYNLNPNAPFSSLPNTDFLDFSTQTGITQNFTATVSGGNKESRFRISAKYENDEGYIRPSTYKDYSINGNFDEQLSSKFSTSLSLNISNQNYVNPCQDNFFINCPISQSTFTSPLARPFNPDGTISTGFPLVGAPNNPAIQLNTANRKDQKQVVAILGHLGGTYDFLPYLSLHSQLSLDYRNTDQSQFRNAIASPGNGGALSQSSAPTSNFLSTTTLNLNKSFADVHNVSGLVGFEYRRNYTQFFSARGLGFPVTNLRVLDATATPVGAGGSNGEYRNASYLGQIKYNYDQRYYAKFAARYEGSSRFGANNRFGFFPAGSVAWNISSEDFFNSNIVSTLKLRASAGRTGNSQIGFFAARGLFSTAPVGNTVTYNGSTGLRPQQLANNDLTWEKSTKFDIGVDYGFVNSRINGTVDVYRTNVNSLLLNSPLPTDSGFESITSNVGKLRNQGIDFDVRSINVRRAGFQWSTRLNFNVNQNTVLALNKNTQSLNPGNLQPVAVGHSVGAYQLVPYAGVNPADGRPFWYDKAGNLTYSPTFNNDKRFVDGEAPDVSGGFGSTLRYKGLSLSGFFQFTYGGFIAPQQVSFFNIAQVGVNGTNGLVRRLNDAWRKPGDISQYPAPHGTNFSYPGSTTGYATASGSSSQNFFDSSYLRLKDLTIAYSLPTSLTEKIGLRDIRLHITGLNLITWTSFPGFGPEISNTTSLNGNSNSIASIPVGRQVTGGISVKF